MPPQVSQSDAVKALMRVAGKSWVENRKVTDEGPSALTVPENTVCISKLTKAYVSLVKTGDNKGKPYVAFHWVIIEPEKYKGQQFKIQHKIYESGNRTIAMGIQYLCIDLQRLGRSLEPPIDTSDLDLAKLPAVLARLLPKEKLIYRTHLSKLGTGYDPRVEILGVPGEEDIAPEDAEAVQGEEEEEGPETEGGESGDGSNDGAEVAEEEYEEWEPAKGEKVNILPPRSAGKAEILKINKTRRVLDMRNLKTKKIYKDVSWEEVEPVEEA